MTQSDVELWLVMLGLGLLVAFAFTAFLFLRVAKITERINELQKHLALTGVVYPPHPDPASNPNPYTI